ncbi:MAG: chemotaxis protein CheD [Halanaerobiales bacterium]
MDKLRKIYSRKYEKDIYEIFAGEFFVTKKKNILIKTLLGSCVAVLLRDRAAGVLGVNHFMLPGNPRTKNKDKGKDFLLNKDTRYGINAMELMINDMMKKGAVRKNFEAKVFGGGKIIKSGLNKVAVNNIDFILDYLNMENIPIKARDLGEDYGRQIIIVPDSFTVYLRKIEISRLGRDTIEREKKLLSRTKDKSKKSGDLTLFD